jgi:hypothetical protein
MKRLTGLVVGLIIASHAASAADGAKIYNFSFDGFCDGMTLTVTSGLYVVGQSTGCFAGGIEEGLIGGIQTADPEAGTKARVLIISSNNFGAGTTATYVINLLAKTWADYVTRDGVTQFENASGTLTFERPAAEQPGLKPSFAP